jgi:hypothetical protein
MWIKFQNGFRLQPIAKSHFNFPCQQLVAFICGAEKARPSFGGYAVCEKHRKTVTAAAATNPP